MTQQEQFLDFLNKKNYTAASDMVISKQIDLIQHLPDGDTYLTRMIFEEKASAFFALLRMGADIEQPDIYGTRPLMHAGIADDDFFLKFLLFKNADVNATTPNGVTALMVASHYNEVDRLQCLIAAGADVFKEDKNGWTAKCHACNAGADEAVEFLSSFRKKTRKLSNQFRFEGLRKDYQR